MSAAEIPTPKAAAPAKAAPAKPAAAKAAPKAAKPKAPAKAAPRGAGQAPAGPDPFEVILHPVVTEKTMMLMDRNNSLEFLVRRSATRTEVKGAVESLFSCEVASVNTRITKDGKRAIVKFGGESSAEDIGMRIGVF